MEKFNPSKVNSEKVVISIRIDLKTLEKIDKEADKVGISRNEFITQGIDFALTNMNSEESNSKKK